MVPLHKKQSLLLQKLLEENKPILRKLMRKLCHMVYQYAVKLEMDIGWK